MHPLDQQAIRILTLHAARAEEERDRAVAECQRLAAENAKLAADNKALEVRLDEAPLAYAGRDE